MEEEVEQLQLLLQECASLVYKLTDLPLMENKNQNITLAPQQICIRIEVLIRQFSDLYLVLLSSVIVHLPSALRHGGK